MKPSEISDAIHAAIVTAEGLGYKIRRVRIADVELELVPVTRPPSKEEIDEERTLEHKRMRYAHTGLIPQERPLNLEGGMNARPTRPSVV